MKKFFVLFGIPVAAMEEWKSKTSPEDMKTQSEALMKEWQGWMAEHEAIFIDKGAPLGKTKHVTGAGVTDTKNDFNWYVVVQGESLDEVANLFAGHPQLKTIPQAYVEVMDIPHLGM